MRRWDFLRVAAWGLGMAMLLVVAAYGFAAVKSGVATGGVVAAIAAASIAGCGLLYAFRLGAGGRAD